MGWVIHVNDIGTVTNRRTDSSIGNWSEDLNCNPTPPRNCLNVIDIIKQKTKKRKRRGKGGYPAVNGPEKPKEIKGCRGFL